MFFTFLKHDWLSFRRSPTWGQGATQAFLLGFLGLYFLISFLGLAFYAPILIEEYYPDTPIMEVVNRYLIYYLLGDLATRFFVQKFPSMNIGHYLMHNIQKSTICRYLCTRSLFSFFNIAPLFFLIPFFFVAVIGAMGIGAGLHWLLMALLLVVLNHFLAFYIDKSLNSKASVSISLIGILSIAAILDYNGYYSLGEVFRPIFEYTYQHLIGLAVLFALVGAVYVLVYKLFRSNAYIDLEESSIEVSSLEFGIFDRFGPRLSGLMQQEAKLIWRNKRPKAFIFISLIFLLYPLLFLSKGDELLDSNFMLIAMGLIITGAFSLNYGQLLLSWNSSHFDFILAQNIRIRDFLESKYMILAMSNAVLYILSLPYAFFFPKMFLVNTVMFFFNTGFTIFGYLYLNINSAKKIDISKGAMFNHEGFGAAHYLMMMPLILAPILIYWLFWYFGLPILGLFAIALLGISGIVFRKPILKNAEQKLIDNKYKLGAGFRK